MQECYSYWTQSYRAEVHASIGVAWNSTDNAKEFITACQLIHSLAQKTNDVAERVVRRVEEVTAATVQSGFPEERWDCAMKCCCLRNVHEMADGKTAFKRRCGVTLDGPVIPFGARASYKPISSTDESRLHQFA